MDELPSDIYFEISKHLDIYSIKNFRSIDKSRMEVIKEVSIYDKIDEMHIESKFDRRLMLRLTLFNNKTIYKKINYSNHSIHLMLNYIKKFRSVIHVDLKFSEHIDPIDYMVSHFVLIRTSDIFKILHGLPISIKTIDIKFHYPNYVDKIPDIFIEYLPEYKKLICISTHLL